INTLRKKNNDGFELLLNNLISEYMGAEFSPFIHVKFEKYEDKTVCIIEIERSSQPIFVKKRNNKEFYIRQGNSTRLLDSEETHNYIDIHWD
ncbi:MAG: AlbA family DNA-binding domain-containing protein, partial [Promethearchaeota archaeon]